MSSYEKLTKHPKTGEWEKALWIDDRFGKHDYGVKFSDGEIFNPNLIDLETKEETMYPTNLIPEIDTQNKMTKFKIIRNITTTDGQVVSDEITIQLERNTTQSFIAFPSLRINTKDLPDLIKALQDKQKEIMK